MASEPSNSAPSYEGSFPEYPADQIRRLTDVLRSLYMGDEMFVELRLIRTLSAVRQGTVSLEQAIAEFAAEARAAA